MENNNSAIHLIVFTDLDGTLLDHDTYSYEKAEEGIGLLRLRRIPMILVSSKTFHEMKLLHIELGLDTPFVFENGCGIAGFSNGRYLTEPAGPSPAEMKKILAVLEQTLQITIVPITEYTPEALALATGLSIEKARLAQMRTASLPFIVTSRNTAGLEEMNRVLNARGFTVTRGGRFYHLLPAGIDKGSAVRKIKEQYEKNNYTKITAACIGDSESDIPMLESADLPFLVRKKNGKYIECNIKGIFVTGGTGPEGFTEAVKEILSREGVQHGDSLRDP